MNRIPVLPTLLTLGNGVCGFAAIAYASKISLDGSMPLGVIDDYFLLSAALILVAMVFDVLDGYAARLSRTASAFGGQLDSLCDAISFGAAPAFLLLRLGQEWNEHFLIARCIAVIAALYMACAVLRLARFNIENTPDSVSISPVQKTGAGSLSPVQKTSPGSLSPVQKTGSGNQKRFKGLPSPAAAGCIVSLAVLRSDASSAWTGLDAHVFVRFWAPIGTFVAALLMVSQFSYPHLTRQLLRGRRGFKFVVQAVLLLCLIVLWPPLALFLLFWTYALLGPVRYVILHARRQAEPEHSIDLARSENELGPGLN